MHLADNEMAISQKVHILQGCGSALDFMSESYRQLEWSNHIYTLNNICYSKIVILSSITVWLFLCNLTQLCYFVWCTLFSWIEVKTTWFSIHIRSNDSPDVNPKLCWTCFGSSRFSLELIFLKITINFLSYPYQGDVSASEYRNLAIFCSVEQEKTGTLRNETLNAEKTNFCNTKALLSVILWQKSFLSYI